MTNVLLSLRGITVATRDCLWLGDWGWQMKRIRYHILTDGGDNTKLAKSNKAVDWYTVSLSLAQAKTSGYEVCGGARTPACTRLCVGDQGRARVWPSISKGRIKRTKLFFEDRPAFLDMLWRDMDKATSVAESLGRMLAMRPNTFSDLDWPRMVPELFTRYPDCQFYDYTGVYLRMRHWLDGHLPDNYHLTFSRKEHNHRLCVDILLRGGNCAFVFDGTPPRRAFGFDVIPGDDNDQRWLEGRQGKIVGLYQKGYDVDDSGFVIPVASLHDTRSLI